VNPHISQAGEQMAPAPDVTWLESEVLRKSKVLTQPPKTCLVVVNTDQRHSEKAGVGGSTPFLATPFKPTPNVWFSISGEGSKEHTKIQQGLSAQFMA
jgi:hypothetical protein